MAQRSGQTTPSIGNATAPERLPAFFRDRYLSPDSESVRLSGLPADLARDLDAAVPASERFSLAGIVLHCMNPKPLADNVGPVSTSIIPAVLDELLRRSPSAPLRDDGLRASYFVDMFAVLALQASRASLLESGALARKLMVDALNDHFAEVSRTLGDGSTSGLDDEVDTLVSECNPTIELFEVTFQFAAKREPRGARLLDYLFDERPPSLAPAPWPKLIRL
jgi:hypothetical protein